MVAQCEGNKKIWFTEFGDVSLEDDSRAPRLVTHAATTHTAQDFLKRLVDSVGTMSVRATPIVRSSAARAPGAS
jgi:hypothetical protein